MKFFESVKDVEMVKILINELMIIQSEPLIKVDASDFGTIVEKAKEIFVSKGVAKNGENLFDAVEDAMKGWDIDKHPKFDGFLINFSGSQIMMNELSGMIDYCSKFLHENSIVILGVTPNKAYNNSAFVLASVDW